MREETSLRKTHRQQKNNSQLIVIFDTFYAYLHLRKRDFAPDPRQR